MPTTEQVLASHAAALGDQDPAKVSTHYAPDAVVIVNGDTYRGRREIASMYERLIGALPGAAWRTDVEVIEQDLAYVEWACEASTASVAFGTDTFLIADGLIARQTASFSIHMKILDARGTGKAGRP